MFYKQSVYETCCSLKTIYSSTANFLAIVKVLDAVSPGKGANRMFATEPDYTRMYNPACSSISAGFNVPPVYDKEDQCAVKVYDSSGKARQPMR